MNPWPEQTLDAVGSFLELIFNHLPNPDVWFPRVLFAMGAAVLLGPGVAGFVGAWRGA